MSQYKESYCYYDEDSESIYLTDIKEPYKEFSSIDDLTEETSVGLKPAKDTYVHVAEGVYYWVEEFEYDEEKEDWIVSEAGYELIKKKLT